MKKCATAFESEDNSLYAVPDWWNDEYKKCKDTDVYEWFAGGDDEKLFTKITSLIPSRESRIINLGCGISRIQDALYDAGYHSITNVDVSSACIDIMRASDTRGMQWTVADLMKPFPFEDGSFDFALDKGTLDALIVDKADHWDIEDDVYETASVYFKEISRCLAPAGVFAQMTFGQPHFRRRLFEREEFGWAVDVHTLDPTRSFHFFVYECRKPC